MANTLPAVAAQQTKSLLPTPQEWALIKEQVSMYVRSGFLPSSIKTPEQGVTIAMKGYELGIPPMQAFAHIHVISGKPAISSELMLALIYSKVPGAIVNFTRTDDTGCELEAKRPGAGAKFSRFAFTHEDAQKAQALTKDTWKKFPAAMYRARAISAMARAMFPDALMGCSYTPEELGASVTDEGEVIETTAAPAAPPRVEIARAQPAPAAKPKAPPPEEPEAEPGEHAEAADAHADEYRIPPEVSRNYAGKRLEDMSLLMLEGALRTVETKNPPPRKPVVQEFVERATAYLLSQNAEGDTTEPA